MSNKIILHSCGGAGISIADKAITYLRNNENEKKAQLVMHGLDTSETNYPNTREFKTVADFWKMENINLDDSYFDGSGGVRGHNSESIVKGVQAYLDAKKYLAPKKGELHVILAGASGGSGNIIASMLLKNLLDKGVPVTLIIVGDDNSAKAAENTRKALTTLNSIAGAKRKRITTMRLLFNNNKEGNNILSAYEDVDAEVAIHIDVLRTFNGELRDLDFQDLVNIVSPKGEDFSLPIGMYTLQSRIGENKEVTNDKTIVMTRTIITNPETFKGISVMHSKIGQISDESLKEKVINNYNVDGVPSNINLLLISGGLKSELDYLTERETTIKENLDKIKLDMVAVVDSDEQDENGLVL